MFVYEIFYDFKTQILIFTYQINFVGQCSYIDVGFYVSGTSENGPSLDRTRPRSVLKRNFPSPSKSYFDFSNDVFRFTVN